MRKQKSYFSYQTIYLLVLIACFSIYVSCSSTRLVATWKDKNYAGAPLTKIIVIGIFKNLENRKVYENAIVRKIKEHGTEAVASLSFMEPDKEYKYKEMETIFNAQKIDGILIVRIKGVDKKEEYYPPVEVLVPEDPDVIYFDHYMRFYTVMEDPGYLQETDIFRMECTLYTNDNDHLIWTTEAKTIESDISGEEPVNSSDDAAELATLVTLNLEKNHLIK